MMKRILMGVLLTMLMSTMAMAQGIVGTWQADTSAISIKAGDAKGDVFVTFNADKTFNMRFHVRVPSDIDKMRMVIIADIVESGTYKVESESKLTLKPNEDGMTGDIDVQFPDFDKAQADALKNMMMSQLDDGQKKLMLQSLEETLFKEFDEEIMYKLDGDKLTVNARFVMNRVKNNTAKK